jgi:hypothetical protein
MLSRYFRISVLALEGQTKMSPNNYQGHMAEQGHGKEEWFMGRHTFRI